MDVSGKTFLVTGGGGFIGKHLVKLLDAAGSNVIVFDNFSRSSRSDLEALGLQRTSVFEDGGDIRETEVLDQAVSRVDGIFHLAAMWLLHCQKYPTQAMEVNIAGSANVFAAAAKFDVPVVFSSSASVYGDAREYPMTEEHPLDAQNLYGATKIAAEKIAVAYSSQYGLKHIALRYMNVYGPFQDQKAVYSGVIPRMLEHIEVGKDLEVMGDGTQTYDFITARDVARANILAMQSEVFGSHLNVGTGVGTSLTELCELVLELTGSKVEVRHRPYSEGDARQLVTKRVGDARLAKQLIGFEAEDSLEDGLRELIMWRSSPEQRA